MKSPTILLALYTLSWHTCTTRAFGAATRNGAQMETTVRNYFQGVHTKDAALIRSCFGDTSTIRDVCGLNASQRTVPAEDLVQRCMDFVAAHPDVSIDFHYGPVLCGSEQDEPWVFAHWYETGTWSGESCGIPPANKPMACEGQTRFRVDPETMKIKEFVVTRTFTDWEKAFIEKQKQLLDETTELSS